MADPRRPRSLTPSSPTLQKMTAPYASVLVVSSDAQIATELRALVPARTAVFSHSRAADLVRDLRVLRGQRRMIIVDLALRALLEPARAEPALIEGALVVLWRATQEDEAAMRAHFPGVTFVRCGDRAGVRELAAFVHLGH